MTLLQQFQARRAAMMQTARIFSHLHRLHYVALTIILSNRARENVPTPLCHKQSTESSSRKSLHKTE